jgi:hypothetical protein
MTASSASLYLDDIPVGHRHVTQTYIGKLIVPRRP